MLTTNLRIKLQEIANRVAAGEFVSLADASWAQKLADHNRSAYSILRTARRRAAAGGPPITGSMDELIHGMDLGDPDPNTHLTGPQSPEALAEFFRAPDWLRYD